MKLLNYLIELYESNESLTVEDFLINVFKKDSLFKGLNKSELIELKRSFFDYLNFYDNPERITGGFEELKDLVTIDDEITQRFEYIEGSHRKNDRPRIKYVEAFINNISVPKTLNELYNYYLDGNDAQGLAEESVSSHKTRWTVPNWAKQGDIVLFMHAKYARSTLTRLRTELRKKLNPDSVKAKKLEKAISAQLEFHNKYGGKIFAIGRVNGIPELENEIDPELHFKSKLFCKIDNLFLLERPIDISEFNNNIMISRQSAITPVFGEQYDFIKNLIISKNNVQKYFELSYSTPYPHLRVNNDNWMKLGLEYRNAFSLESQFRHCYVDYLLSAMGDQKSFYAECACHKGNSPTTYVDNVMWFDKMLLPIEVKLNIKAEIDLEGQCEQYCHLDSLFLKKDSKLPVANDKVINDKVIIIDTFGVYFYFSMTRSIIAIYDFDDLKTIKDLDELKVKISEHLS